MYSKNDRQDSGNAKAIPPISKSMGEPLNSAGADFEITYSADGKTALFTSTRPGSIESGTPYNFDIWKVEKKDGVWQKPQSLGSRINSPYRDHLHWIGLSKDGKKFTGGWDQPGTYDLDVRWVSKDDIPLLKNFEPVGSPPNLLAGNRAK